MCGPLTSRWEGMCVMQIYSLLGIILMSGKPIPTHTMTLMESFNLLDFSCLTYLNFQLLDQDEWEPRVPHQTSTGSSEAGWELRAILCGGGATEGSYSLQWGSSGSRGLGYLQPLASDGRPETQYRQVRSFDMKMGDLGNGAHTIGL